MMHEGIFMRLKFIMGLKWKFYKELKILKKEKKKEL